MKLSKKKWWNPSSNQPRETARSCLFTYKCSTHPTRIATGHVYPKCGVLYGLFQSYIFLLVSEFDLVLWKSIKFKLYDNYRQN